MPRNIVPDNRTSFQKWLETFIKEKDIDMSEEVRAGDGSILQVGDVMTAINNAPEEEQAEIKHAFVQLDFKNSDILDYIKHLAQALDKSYKN